MGCWNGTCMISNLPINDGDEIKLIFLHQKYGRIDKNPIIGQSAYVYSTDLLTPAFLAINGQYNDYGGIEGVDEDWNYKLIENYLRTKYPTVKLEGDIKKDGDYTLMDFIEGIERGSFGDSVEVLAEGDKRRKEMAERAMEAYKDNPEAQESWKEVAEMDVSEQWRPANFSFVMVRKDIWDHICNSKNDSFWNDEDEVDEKGNTKYYIDARTYCERNFKKEMAAADDMVKKFLDRVDESTLTDEEIQEIKDDAAAFNKLFRGSSGYCSDLKANDEYTKALYNDDIDNDAVFQAWFEMTAINSHLSGTRTGWMIQAGAGSQHDGWEEHKSIAEKIIEICDEKIEEYDDE